MLITVVFVLVLTGLLSARASSPISIKNNAATVSKHLIYYGDELTVVVMFDGLGSHTLHLMQPPDAMPNTDIRDTVLVTVEDPDACSSAACVGVFTDSLSVGNMMGCLGTVYSCANNAMVELRSCAVSTATTDTEPVVGVIPAYSNFMLVVGATTASIGKNTTIRIRTRLSVRDKDITCPSVSVSNVDKTIIDLAVEGIATAGMLFAAGQQQKAFLDNSSAVSLAVDKNIIGHGCEGNCVRVIAIGPALNCFSGLDVLLLSDYSLLTSFGHDFDIFMRSPVRKVMITYESAKSGLPPTIFAIFTLYDANNALVDSKARMYDESAPTVLDIAMCKGTHMLAMQIMYLDGGHIFSTSKRFNPSVFCVNQGFPYNCFCDAGPAPKKRRSSKEFTLDVSLARDGHPAVVVSYVKEVTVQPNVYCYALDLVTGTSVVNASATRTDNTCSLMLNYGSYIVQHGSNLHVVDAAEFVSDDFSHVYDVVIVCQTTEASLTVLSTNEENGGISYLHVDTGVDCPDTPRDATLVDLHRTDIAVTGISWFVAPEHGAAFEHIAEHENQHNIWYPLSGHYRADITLVYSGQTEVRSVFLVVENTHELRDAVAPICKDTRVLLDYNHLPQLPTDYNAYSTLTVLYTPSNVAAKRTQWSVQVFSNQRQGNWMLIDDTMVYRHQLRVGVDYMFKLMRVEYGFSDVIATSACYFDAGTIMSKPPIVMRVMSPVQVFSCDTDPAKTMVLFDVFFSNTDIPPVPFSGINIEYYSTDKAVTDSVVTYIAGPLDADNYHKGLLVLVYKIGLYGQVTDETLDYIIANRLYPPVVLFAIQDLAYHAATDLQQFHHRESMSGGFHCGKDDIDTVHQFRLSSNNPTRLTQYVTLPDGSSLDVLRSETIGSTSSLFFAVAPSEIGRQEKSYIHTGLDGKLSKTIVQRNCPVKRLEYTLPPYIPLDIEVTVVPLDQADIDDADVICAGKRFFRFGIPGSDPNPISYKTDNDPDLGTVTLYNGIALPITINRDSPILIYTYYNGATNLMGTRLSCTTSISSVVFAADDFRDSTWALREIDITASAVYRSACSMNSGHSVTAMHSGGFVLDMNAPIYDDPPSVTLAAPDGIPILYRGYPSRPKKDKYIYSGLDTGVYISDLTLNDPTGRFTCVRSALFFVETTNENEMNNLIVMDKTSHGTKKMLCPKTMYADAHSWLEYYTITLDTDIYTDMLRHGTVVDVVIWKYGRKSQLTSFRAGADSMITYRIPEPGTYVAEIVASNDKLQTRCSHPLPPYVLEEPMFTIDSFAMEVIRYPSCAYSADGVIRINYPTSVISQVEITLISCAAYLDGSSCVRQAAIDDGNDGFVFISDLPFASRLVFRYEIMGACSFDGVYTFVPSPNMHPITASIRYTPSCNLMHMVHAVFVDGDFEATLTRGNGKTFQWSLGSKVMSTDDVLYVDPRRDAGAVVSLSITYNKVCTTMATFLLDNMFVPPMVTIDPLLYDTTTRSLPVFCPGQADAMLVATIDPPLQNKTLLEWRHNGTALSGRNVAHNNPVTVTAYALEHGEYSLSYTASVGDVICTATDTVTVPSKEQYNVVNSMDITQATCVGGLSQASIRQNTMASLLGNEINMFYGDMFGFDDRQYVHDKGSGTTDITGVPDGHRIRIMIPYSPAYTMRTREFCETPLVIDFGKVARPPVFATDVTSDQLFLYVPKWHADSVVTEQNNQLVVSTATSGCVTVFPSVSANHGKDKWQYVLSPVKQRMACAYNQPQYVSVYRKYMLTGDLFLLDTYQPLNFNNYLRSIDPEFSITTPQALSAINTTIVDALCNKNPVVRVRIVLAIPADTHVDVARVVVTGYVSIANKPVVCVWEDTGVMLCDISRDEGFSVNIGYTSSTGGSCELTVNLYDVIIQARRYVPRVTVTTTGVDHTWRACLDKDTHATCYTGKGYSVYTFKSFMPDGCAFEYSVPVYEETRKIVHGLGFRRSDGRTDVGNDEDVVTVVQTMQPSCHGTSDGVIVWKIGPTVNVHKEDAGKFAVTNNNGTRTLIQGGLSAGVHWIRYTINDDGVIRYKTATLYSPEPIAYVIQPSRLPPPVYRSGASTSIGLPTMASDVTNVTIYISGGSEMTDVAVTGTKISNGDTVTIPCDLENSYSMYWNFWCTSTLLPGYKYDFTVSCGNSASARRSGGHSITLLSQLSVNLVVVKHPASAYTSNGEFSVEIDGGFAPFTIIVNDRVIVKTALRKIWITNQPSGVAETAILDALGTVTVAHVTLVPYTSFEILDVAVARQEGCGDNTRTYVNVKISIHAKPSRVGAWNEFRSDVAILACSDARMTAAITQIDEFIVIELPSVGQWHIAVCSGDWLVSATNSQVVRAEPQQTALDITVVGGEVCALDGTNGYGTKQHAAIHVTGATGYVRARRKYSRADDTFASYMDVVTLYGLNPGMYVFEVYEVNKMCIIETEVSVVDVGTGVCGTCDAALSLSCVGCDGVPYSSKKLDNCGVCDGDNSCINNCDITSQDHAFVAQQLETCAGQGRQIVVETPIVLVDIAIDNAARIHIVGPVTFTGQSSFTSATDIVFSDGVVLRDQVVLNGMEITIRKSVLVDCQLLLNNITQQVQTGDVHERRLSSVTYESSIRTVLLGITTLYITIENSPISDSDITFNVSIVYTINMTNTTIERIKIVGDFPALNLTIDYNSSIPVIDVRDAAIPAGKTMDEFACVLFTTIPTLHTISSSTGELARSSFSCTGFGVADVVAQSNNQKRQVQTVAIVSSALGIFGMFAYYLHSLTVKSQ